MRNDFISSFISGNSEDGLPVPCEADKRYLIGRITGNFSEAIGSFVNNANVDEPCEDGDDFDDFEFEAEPSVEDSIAKTRHNLWLKDILKDVMLTLEEQDNGDRDNIMYNPAFSKYFMNLCKLLPLWSAICYKHFKGAPLIATSANSESYFNDLKLSHHDIIPCSADKFVEADLELINGMIIDASQNYIEFVRNVTMNPMDETVMDIDNDFDRSTNERTMVSSTNMNNNTAESFDETYHTSNESSPRSEDGNIAIRDKNIVISETFKCLACARNDFPSGAHKCWKCGKAVHILPGCSNSCGDEEGYGERRECIACSFEKNDVGAEQSTRPISTVVAAIREMDSKENWNKAPKRKTKKSKYLSSAPNWHLNTNVDKKVKIGILSNGNLSKVVHKIGQKVIALRNTCGFDSIAQVIKLCYDFARYKKLNQIRFRS